MKKKLLSLSVISISLLFLPHCDMFKGKSEEQQEKTAPTGKKEMEPAVTGEILYKLDGKPLITAKDFEEYRDEMMKAQPQLKQFMEFMPNMEKELFDNMKKEYLVQHWVKVNKLDEMPEYQRDRNLGIKFLNRQLAIKTFQEEYPKKVSVQVTDAEARKIYDERKETTPELIVSRGGITAKGVEFKNEADAQTFLEKVKAPGADFDKVAKDEKKQVKDFKEVTAQSFELETPVREKLLSITKFPSVELVKSKDNVWVIKAIDKKEAEYVPFEQVKEPIKQQLKMQKLFGEELDKLERTFKPVENVDYFERRKKEKEEKLEKMRKAQEAASNQTKKQPAKTPVQPKKPAVPQQTGAVKGM